MHTDTIYIYIYIYIYILTGLEQVWFRLKTSLNEYSEAAESPPMLGEMMKTIRDEIEKRWKKCIFTLTSLKTLF